MQKELTQTEKNIIAEWRQKNGLLGDILEYLIYKKQSTVEDAVANLSVLVLDFVHAKEYLLIYEYFQFMLRLPADQAHKIIIDSNISFLDPHYSSLLSYIACNGDNLTQNYQINAQVYESLFSKIREDKALCPPKDSRGNLPVDYAKKYNDTQFIESYNKAIDNNELSLEALTCMFEYYHQYFSKDPEYFIFAAALRNQKYSILKIIDHFKDLNVLLQFMEHADNYNIEVLKELENIGIIPKIPKQITAILHSYYTYLSYDKDRCFQGLEDLSSISNEVQKKLKKIEKAFSRDVSVVIDIGSYVEKKLLHYLVEYSYINGPNAEEYVKIFIRHFNNNGLCIDHKTSVFSPSDSPLLPLELAFKRSLTNMIKFFITEVYNKQQNVYDQDGPMHNAIFYGNIEIVDFLVQELKLDINKIEPINVRNLNKEIIGPIKMTLLNLALHYKKYTVAQKLLELGANINIIDTTTDISFVHGIAACGDFETLEFMVKHGLDVNQKDSFGNIIAYYLTTVPEILHGSLKEIVEIVRKAGANFHAKNDKGESLLDSALKHKCLNIFKNAILKNEEEKSELIPMKTEYNREDILPYPITENFDGLKLLADSIPDHSE